MLSKTSLRLFYLKRITLLYSKFDFSTFFAFVFWYGLKNIRKKDHFTTLLYFIVKLIALVRSAQNDLRLLEVNSQLNDWSIRVNNCTSIPLESTSMSLIDLILFWTRFSIKVWVVSYTNKSMSLNSFCFSFHSSSINIKV